MKSKMKLEDKIGLVVLILGFSFILLYPYYQWKKEGNKRYTIGMLNGITATRGAWDPIFYYAINDTLISKRGHYQTIVTPQNKKLFLGKKFYVMFDENDFTHASILLDYPVPDSIKTAPPFGWDSIPYVGELEIPFVWDGGKSPPVKKK